jgi:hypothetical protein
MPPHWQGILWGTLPFGSSLLAILVVLIPEERRREHSGDRSAASLDFAPGSMVS